MSDWLDLPLERLANISSGGTPSRATPAFWGGNIPWVTPSDITACKTNHLLEVADYITEKGLSSSSAKLIPQGALLLTSRATIGDVKIAAMPLATNQGFKNIVVHDQIDGDFLFYQLTRLKGSFIRYAAGSTFLEINRKDTGRVLVPHPKNKSVQQKIARILQTIDRAIQQTEALIDKYQQIKAGLMHDLFTRGIGPDGQLRPPHEQAPHLYQQTPIGWIPKDWHYEHLDDLAVRGSGHTPSKSHPEYWNGGIKWLSLADSPNLDQLYISETAFEISNKGVQNSSAVLHPPGIVVLSRDAGIGKSAITTAPMAVSQHFMCWKGGPSMDNHFLYYWLQNNKRMFENIAMGSTILTIGLSYFKRLRIACPQDILEQMAAAERLKSIDTKIFSLQADLKKKQRLKSGLMHDLLTGKVGVIG